jgi:hypothetical protein
VFYPSAEIMGVLNRLSKLTKNVDCAPMDPLEKEEKVLDYKKLDSARTIEQKNLQAKEQGHARIGVSNTQVGSAPRLSGVAGKYKIGKTSNGLDVHSHFENPAHDSFSAKDHGDAAHLHVELRNSLRQDKGVNPALAEHHHNQAMWHSKAQAEKLRSTKKSMDPMAPAPAHPQNKPLPDPQAQNPRNLAAAPKAGQIKPSHQKLIKSIVKVIEKETSKC